MSVSTFHASSQVFLSLIASVCLPVTLMAEHTLSVQTNQAPVKLPDRPLSVPAVAEASKDDRLTQYDIEAHAQALRRRLADETFTVVVEAPFVVVGDERARLVRRRAEKTVRWAVQQLKKIYFARDPESVIEIWLFRDDASYQRWVPKIFGQEPPTRFGYMSAEHNALIINVGTGTGTLVHEIVHPFMTANFPQCPPWFDEGLASLYEQSEARDGTMHGLTNWRLAFLQKAIRTRELHTFEALMNMDKDAFYDDKLGTHYAQARYLCFYLQEKGLLQAFYTSFQKEHARDPSGLSILKAILEIEDMASFQQEWEDYVMKLRFH